MLHPDKPEILKWISEKTWENLSLKEKDYFIFKYVDGIKKEELMRKLYLTSNGSYRNFLCKIKKIIKGEIKT